MTVWVSPIGHPHSAITENKLVLNGSYKNARPVGVPLHGEVLGWLVEVDTNGDNRVSWESWLSSASLHGLTILVQGDWKRLLKTISLIVEHQMQLQKRCGGGRAYFRFEDARKIVELHCRCSCKAPCLAVAGGNHFFYLDAFDILDGC